MLHIFFLTAALKLYTFSSQAAWGRKLHRVFSSPTPVEKEWGRDRERPWPWVFSTLSLSFNLWVFVVFSLIFWPRGKLSSSASFILSASLRVNQLCSFNLMFYLYWLYFLIILCSTDSTTVCVKVIIITPKEFFLLIKRVKSFELVFLSNWA